MFGTYKPSYLEEKPVEEREDKRVGKPYDSYFYVYVIIYAPICSFSLPRYVIDLIWPSISDEFLCFSLNPILNGLWNLHR